MKKLILSTLMMVFLMSFTNKVSNNETIVSPECFEYADSVVAELQVENAMTWDDEYSIFSWYYESCELNNDYDEFQFPE